MAEKMSSFVPTLYVGLGGTGQNVVGKIKQKIESQFGTLEGLPVYFIVIDTDTTKRNLYNFKPDEFIEISDFDGASVILKLERYPMVRNWWPENIKPSDVGNVNFGAGQTRPVGRLAFYYKYADVIREPLERKTKELTTIRSTAELKQLEKLGIALEQNTVSIYVIC